jgi:mannose-1-phosphate guanylyltransferase/mannose-6-phosphate isomerase
MGRHTTDAVTASDTLRTYSEEVEKKTLMYGSILAGGSGTRLWPLSTPETPKQFLQLMSDRTMLQETVERVAPFIAPDQLYVVTFEQYREAVAAQLPTLPTDHILAEPLGRGTAASIGLAATLIAAREPTAVMGSFHADAAIVDVAGFRRALAFAEQVARDGYLVTLGITPTYPETGYGYIQAGQALATSGELSAYSVSRFVEKPQREVAEGYLRAGNYSWNSGIFLWRVDRILEEMRRHVPQIADVLDEIGAAARTTGGRMTPEVEQVMHRAWQRLTENVTIDVGIMEHADRIVVIPIAVGWNDIGSWTQVAALHPRDDAGNTIVGIPREAHLSVRTADTLIFSTTGRRIATAGVEGLVIVDTPDGVLVCSKEYAQLVKELAEQARQRQKG